MLEVKTIEDVTVVGFAHGKVNALDLEFCRAITATFAELSGGPHRGIVLTGQGSAFSAGVDLWRIVEGGDSYVAEFIPALCDAFLAVFTCAKPVVAAVNGHAIAGGCVFTSACDYRIMTTGRAGIGIPELIVGVPFPSVPIGIMEHALGAPKARVAAFTAKIYQPQEALEFGLVDELASPDALVNYAVSHAYRLATTIPADTFGLMKKRHSRSLTESSTFDPEVVRIWQKRASDGWIADYMNRTVRRP